MPNIRDLIALPDPPEARALDTFPAYKTLQARLAELSARRTSTAARLSEVSDILQQQSAQQIEARDLLHSREPLADALDGLGIDVALVAERDGLRREIIAIDAALKQGNRELSTLARKHAGEALAEVRRWHADLVARMADHLLHLLRFADAERMVLGAAEQAGYSAGAVAPFGPSCPAWVDVGTVAQWFRDQTMAGILPASKEPFRSAARLDEAPPRFRHTDKANTFTATTTPSRNGSAGKKVRS